MGAMPDPGQEPPDPIAAAIHPDPYPYYGRLVAERPLFRDSRLGIWVAASAAAVAEVLRHPASRVRPLDEPVPPTLAGSLAGEVFGRLVRMTDGPRHAALKPAIAGALEQLHSVSTVSTAASCTARLAARLRPEADSARLAAFSLQVPLHVIASLLGVGEADLPETASAAGDLANSFLAGASGEQVVRGSEAARSLAAGLRRSRPMKGSLLAAIIARVAGTDVGRDETTANAVGLLTQARDATAGLIGLSLLALARDPELAADVRRSPDLLPAVIEEVARFDSPVQNTRRFLSESVDIMGHRLDRGDPVLVLLAAANRDPQANPNPHQFLPRRTERRLFTFGLGPHACPGGRLAVLMAHAAIMAVLDRGLDPARLETRRGFHPSANLRLPVLSFLA